MEVYKIVRMYFSDDIKNKTIKRNLSLKEAQEHCTDKETSSSTCTLKKNLKHTKKYGAWFDGFTNQK